MIVSPAPSLIIVHRLPFRSHISASCSSCFYHVRDLRRICRYPGQYSANYLLCCLGTSITALHFCRNLKKLGVSSIDWPVLLRSSRHLLAVFHCLCSLHWLPLQFRTDFKICLLTYETLCEKQPVYLQALLPHSSQSEHTWESLHLSGQGQNQCTRKDISLLCPLSPRNSLPLSVRSGP